MPKVVAKPTVYSYFGQRVSSDTAGPFPELSSGFKYVVCFYDYFTKYVAIYFLRTHYGNEVLMALKSFVLDHKRYLDKTKVPGVIDQWHTDNGTEFVTTNIDEYCREVSTRHSMSPPYTPTRNASAERVWGIVLRPVANMIAHAGKDDTKLALWPYAMLASGCSYSQRSTYAWPLSALCSHRTGRWRKTRAGRAGRRVLLRGACV